MNNVMLKQPLRSLSLSYKKSAALVPAKPFFGVTTPKILRLFQCEAAHILQSSGSNRTSTMNIANKE